MININTLINKFINNYIKLKKSDIDNAKNRRNYLTERIDAEVSENKEFFNINKEKSIFFGSFARNTKIIPLNDIDLMICLNAKVEPSYTKYDNVKIKEVIAKNCDLKKLYNNNHYLDSEKVKKKFLRILKDTYPYIKSEKHNSREGIELTLNDNLNFDLIPCFYSEEENFYLIPSENGNWKITNPMIDKSNISDLNQKLNGKLLDLIRLIKYWERERKIGINNSYLLETMILHYFNNRNICNILLNIIDKDKLLRYSTIIDIVKLCDDSENHDNFNNVKNYFENCDEKEIKIMIQNIIKDSIITYVITKSNKEQLHYILNIFYSKNYKFITKKIKTITQNIIENSISNVMTKSNKKKLDHIVDNFYNEDYKSIIKKIIKLFKFNLQIAIKESFEKYKEKREYCVFEIYVDIHAINNFCYNEDYYYYKVNLISKEILSIVKEYDEDYSNFLQIFSGKEILKIFENSISENSISENKQYESFLIIKNSIKKYCNSHIILDIEFSNILKYLEYAIQEDVEDLKGIQGNLNNLTKKEKNTISKNINFQLDLVKDANYFKEINEEENCCEIWKEILGDDFYE